MMDFMTHHAGTIGLIIFFLFFISMLIWVFRPGTKQAYTNHASIPLKEGEDE